jgi:hypothetical protein
MRSMEVHTWFKMSLRLAPSAISSSVCFSAANSCSACLRSAISVLVPYHRTIFPFSSQSVIQPALIEEVGRAVYLS